MDESSTAKPSADVIQLSEIFPSNHLVEAGVFPCGVRPGTLVKIFRQPLDPLHAQLLGDLIELPDKADSADRKHLRSGACWPTARVVGADGAVVGCLVPRAPDKFTFTYVAPSGRKSSRFLEIDWLANPDATLASRGIPPQSFRARLAVCRGIVTIAAVLEKHRLIYSDWSYSNAFWSLQDHSAFVIDVDGCVPDRRPHVLQPNWEDPLTPPESDADTYVDRYRVALLVARCLTGQRRIDRLLHALRNGPALSGAACLRDTLLHMLLSPRREQRPSVRQLLAQLEAVSGHGEPIEGSPTA